MIIMNCSEYNVVKVMRRLETHPGIRIGGHNINNLRYADDTVSIAETNKDLPNSVNITKVQASSWD